MKTKYLAVYGNFVTVQQFQIIKETENFVHLISWPGKECMHPKKTQEASYFDTELEAWRWLYGKACEEHNTAQRRADEKLFIVDKISNEIKKHL